MRSRQQGLVVMIVVSLGCGCGGNGNGSGPVGSWASMADSGAHDAVFGYVVVAAGSKMIVWGGLKWDPGVGDFVYLNTGAFYDPDADSWTPMETSGAPVGRGEAEAVWTGSKMIVWGGYYYDNGISDYVYPVDGGVYDPDTNSWASVTSSQAPSGRIRHTAVWTGTKMIVWGGTPDFQMTLLDTGGIYDPVADSWAPTSGVSAPSPRCSHTAVWTGTKMIVWGASGDGSGGVYDPGLDSWTATAATEAHSLGGHTAVWIGSEMIVWGGRHFDGVEWLLPNAGYRYNPGADSWATITVTGAPSGRMHHAAVWTGARMAVWGGADSLDGSGNYTADTNSGALYDPANDSWVEMTATNAPASRYRHGAVWLGTRLVVWGGAHFEGFVITYLNNGGRFRP